MPELTAPALADVLLEALTAAHNGSPPEATLREAILRQDGVDLATLGFDSLATMEFCISIELQTGAELTPEVLDGLVTMEAVADWIRNWRGSRA
jgi:acyl carrier protein